MELQVDISFLVPDFIDNVYAHLSISLYCRHIEIFSIVY